MARRREYSDEVKGAVMAALLEGQSPSIIAKHFRIPVGTVHSWATRGGDQYRPAPAPETRERIGNLIIDNLEAALETTKAIANAVTDQAWLRTQSASEIAVLYGVISDKTYRILESLPDGDDEADLP